MPLAPHTVAPSSRPGAALSSAKLLRDHQDCVPLRRILSDGDKIVLLSPVVAPLQDGPNGASDPFEPFGQALAARHPWVRHVAYTKRAGVTSTHAAFIKAAKVVIFVISGPPMPDDRPQTELAEISQILSESRPHVVLACFDIQSSKVDIAPFPTILQIRDYSPHELQAAAGLLFGEEAPRKLAALVPSTLPTEPPKARTVRPYRSSDMAGIHSLWQSCLPRKFNLGQSTLASLLDRNGYALHYVVCEPSTDRVVGFCATYLSYVDAGGERLLGSLAAILVDEEHRNSGVGLSLHKHAMQKLTSIRGVDRIQLGSTFPRLLRGLPAELDDRTVAWFERRGWDVEGKALPGVGRRTVGDWVLDFGAFRGPTNLASAGLAFRSCRPTEFDVVLGLVERESARRDAIGWFDQYARLAGGPDMGDILVGMEGRTVVSCALVYTPDSGAQIIEDLPWAEKAGPNFGGVTCVCVADNNPYMVNSRESVMIRLLDACMKVLAERGMKGMLVDGVKGGEEAFHSLGFKQWASYRDIWWAV